MADTADSEPIDAGAELPDEVAAMFDLSLKKKKKKKSKPEAGNEKDKDEGKATEDDQNESVERATSQSSATSNPYGIELDPPTYEYSELLDRVVDFLTNKDPAWSEKRRQTLKAPQLSRVGSKKTVWTNFQEICKMMHRNPDHVFQFMMAELGTEGSIDGSQRLVIRGKFVAKVSFPSHYD
jgi:translation initiation factor 2 subunit 2